MTAALVLLGDWLQITKEIQQFIPLLGWKALALCFAHASSSLAVFLPDDYFGRQ